MPQRRKRMPTTLQRIAKTNPQVNKKLIEESLAIVDSVRQLGFRGRNYEIIGSFESRLRVKAPVLCKL